jgi:hypothetical protein
MQVKIVRYVIKLKRKTKINAFYNPDSNLTQIWAVVTKETGNADSLRNFTFVYSLYTRSHIAHLRIIAFNAT